MNLYNKDINFNIKYNTHNFDKLALALSRLPDRINEHTDLMIKEYVKKVNEDAKKVKPIRFNSTNNIIDQFTKLAEQQNKRNKPSNFDHITNEDTKETVRDFFNKNILPLNPEKDPRLKDLNLPEIKGITYVIDDLIPEDKILVIDKRAVQFIKDTDTGKEYVIIKKHKNKNKSKKMSTKKKENKMRKEKNE